MLMNIRPGIRCGIDAAQKTAPDQWRLQSIDNKQGSGGMLGRELGERLSSSEGDVQATARAVYEERLKLGVARERQGRTCRSQRTRRRTGRSICTICFISFFCGWTLMHKRRSENTPW